MTSQIDKFGGEVRIVAVHGFNRLVAMLEDALAILWLQITTQSGFQRFSRQASHSLFPLSDIRGIEFAVVALRLRESQRDGGETEDEHGAESGHFDRCRMRWNGGSGGKSAETCSQQKRMTC